MQNQPSNPTILLPLAWGGWGLLMYMVFYWRRNAAFKRRWHPRLVVASGGVFLALIALMTFVQRVPLMSIFLIVGVIVVSYLNIRLTRFCDECDAQYMDPMWSPPRAFCPRCRAPLDGKPKPDDDPLG